MESQDVTEWAKNAKNPDNAGHGGNMDTKFNYTDEEFYKVVREKYGSRGVCQAKKEFEKFDAKPAALPPDEQLEYRHLMMDIWMDSKEQAKKFTPKKYLK